MKYSIIILFISFAYFADCQSSKLDSVQENLLYYSDVMINALENSTRSKAALSFESYFNEYLNLGGNLGKDQKHLKYISQISPENDEFTIVSWIIKEIEGTYNYKAYIVFPDNNFKVFNRTDPLSESSAFQTAAIDDWYGCLYYNVLEIGESEYILFGYDAHSKFDKYKLVDYLKVEGSEITLGQEIFEDKTEPNTYLNRLIISYSSDATVVFNFNRGLDMIIHDHLEERMGLQEGQGPTHLPDGTYEGYVYKDKKWKYVEKIYDHVFDDAPRPKPVLNKKKSKKVYEK